jgi:uncharacterized membrane protein required for colicin V production
MLIVDLIIGVLLLGFLVNGYRNGFILTLGQLIGILIGLFMARLWTPFALARLTPFFGGHSGWPYLIIFILIFIFVDQVVALIFRVINTLFKILTIIPFLATINSILGAMLGFVSGATFVGGASYIITTYRVDPTLVSYLGASRLAVMCQNILFSVLHRWL